MVPKAEGVAGKGAGGHFLTNFIVLLVIAFALKRSYGLASK